MENQDSATPVIFPLTEEKQEISLDTSKKKISFKDRFLFSTSAHNRINRMGFFMNVFLLNVGILILASINTGIGTIDDITMFMLLFPLYMIGIQILKRCHDFGNKWYIILAIFIVAIFFALFWVLISLYLWFFYIVFMSWTLIVRLPLIIISCYLLFKSWDPEDNAYWKSFSL